MNPRTPGVRIVLSIVWPVRDGSGVLTPEVIERLEPYLTRYAQTLSVLVHAVGGVGDHLHLLAEIPPTVALSDVQSELQRASARFICNTLNLPGFGWAGGAELVCSIRPDEVEMVAEYVREQATRHERGDLDPDLEAQTPPEVEAEEPPAWLRDVLHPD